MIAGAGKPNTRPFPELAIRCSAFIGSPINSRTLCSVSPICTFMHAASVLSYSKSWLLQLMHRSNPAENSHARLGRP